MNSYYDYLEELERSIEELKIMNGITFRYEDDPALPPVQEVVLPTNYRVLSRDPLSTEADHQE